MSENIEIKYARTYLDKNGNFVSEPWDHTLAPLPPYGFELAVFKWVRRGGKKVSVSVYLPGHQEEEVWLNLAALFEVKER